MSEATRQSLGGAATTGLRPCLGTRALHGPGSGSLASSTRYWYIDNKGIQLEEMLWKASYIWFVHRAFRVFNKADRSGHST